MINKVKGEVSNQKGKLNKFRYNGARNQIEEFEGIISGVYNYIFTIKTIKEETKSFSYSDLLIGNLEFIK